MFDLFILLTCYALTTLISLENGPFDIFFRLREKAGCYILDPDDNPKSELARMVACPDCLGFWIAIPLAFLLPYLWPVSWLGLAGGNLVLQRLTRALISQD